MNCESGAKRRNGKHDYFRRVDVRVLILVMEEEVVITNTSIVLLLKSPKDEIVESQYNLSVASSGISCNGANSSGNPSLLTQNDSLFGGESKKPIYALL